MENILSTGDGRCYGCIELYRHALYHLLMNSLYCKLLDVSDICPHCPYVFDSLNSDIWICIVLCSEFPKFCSFTCVSLFPLIDNTFEVLQRRWRPMISVWMPTLALGYLVALLLPWDPGKNLTRNKNKNRIYIISLLFNGRTTHPLSWG